MNEAHADPDSSSARPTPKDAAITTKKSTWTSTGALQTTSCAVVAGAFIGPHQSSSRELTAGVWLRTSGRVRVAGRVRAGRQLTPPYARPSSNSGQR